MSNGMVKKCSTPGCNRVSRAKGLCFQCYHRRQKLQPKKKGKS